MPWKRLRKQLAYVVGFVVFLVLIIGGPYVLLRGPRVSRVASPTPTPVGEPIVVQSVDVIARDGAIDAVARLYNPNPRAGIAHFRATFILTDSGGKEITRVPVDSHILPGSVHYISALNISTPRPVARVSLDTPANPAYATLPGNITLPSFATFLRERTAQSRGGQTFEEQKGIVTNNSAFDWQEVAVTAIALDENERVIGVGTTFVGRLTSGEQREFTASWPTPEKATARVVAVATTNIFKEDNIIRAVGDPNLLR